MLKNNLTKKRLLTISLAYKKLAIQFLFKDPIYFKNELSLDKQILFLKLFTSKTTEIFYSKP